MVAYLIVINFIKERRNIGNKTKRKNDNSPNTVNTPKLEHDNAFLFYCSLVHEYQ